MNSTSSTRLTPKSLTQVKDVLDFEGSASGIWGTLDYCLAREYLPPFPYRL
jgi:hypothetical protein